MFLQRRLGKQGIALERLGQRPRTAKQLSPTALFHCCFALGYHLCLTSASATTRRLDGVSGLRSTCAGVQQTSMAAFTIHMFCCLIGGPAGPCIQGLQASGVAPLSGSTSAYIAMYIYLWHETPYVTVMDVYPALAAAMVFVVSVAGHRWLHSLTESNQIIPYIGPPFVRNVHCAPPAAVERRGRVNMIS